MDKPACHWAKYFDLHEILLATLPHYKPFLMEDLEKQNTCVRMGKNYFSID
jgi:hypothetical protein